MIRETLAFKMRFRLLDGRAMRLGGEPELQRGKTSPVFVDKYLPRIVGVNRTLPPSITGLRRQWRRRQPAEDVTDSLRVHWPNDQPRADSLPSFIGACALSGAAKAELCLLADAIHAGVPPELRSYTARMREILAGLTP